MDCSTRTEPPYTTLRQSEAAYDETIARYRQTVLSAFSEVENNLAAKHLLAEEYEQEMAALQAARRQLEIAKNRYTSGLVTYLEVATAQNTVLGAERTAVRLKGAAVSGDSRPDQSAWG